MAINGIEDIDIGSTLCKIGNPDPLPLLRIDEPTLTMEFLVNKVGQFPITPDFILKLGYAAGQVLVQHDGGQKPTVLIGKDTRISGYRRQIGRASCRERV